MTLKVIESFYWSFGRWKLLLSGYLKFSNDWIILLENIYPRLSLFCNLSTSSKSSSPTVKPLLLHIVGRTVDWMRADISCLRCNLISIWLILSLLPTWKHQRSIITATKDSALVYLLWCSDCSKWLEKWLNQLLWLLHWLVSEGMIVWGTSRSSKLEPRVLLLSGFIVQLLKLYVDSTTL